MDWPAIAAGAASVSIIGGFLAYIVRMTIIGTFHNLTKGMASMDYVKSKLDTHEQIYHGTKGRMKDEP